MLRWNKDNCDSYMFCLTYFEIYPQNNSHSLGYHFDEKLYNTDSQDQYQKKGGVKTVIDFNWGEDIVI